jgi:hypothetical protein
MTVDLGGPHGERRYPQAQDGDCTYKVQWLLGGRRGAPWQSETFRDRRVALKFQALVDANGQRWPDGWIKGVGFAIVEESLTRTCCSSSGRRTSAA